MDKVKTTAKDKNIKQNFRENRVEAVNVYL